MAWLVAPHNLISQKKKNSHILNLERAWLDYCLLGIEAQMSYSKEVRRKLSQHLFRMHKHRDASQPTLTHEELMTLHSVLHFNDYMCPPHTHENYDEVDVVGDVVETLGKTFMLESIRTIIKDTEEGQNVS